MGPMAKIVLRDQIKTLGESSERFPHAKVEMLLESVSREILDEGMRGRFRQQMLEEIRTLQASSNRLLKKISEARRVSGTSVGSMGPSDYWALDASLHYSIIPVSLLGVIKA